jgi:hypothetical protein
MDRSERLELAEENEESGIKTVVDMDDCHAEFTWLGNDRYLLHIRDTGWHDVDRTLPNSGPGLENLETAEINISAIQAGAILALSAGMGEEVHEVANDTLKRLVDDLYVIAESVFADLPRNLRFIP